MKSLIDSFKNIVIPGATIVSICVLELRFDYSLIRFNNIIYHNLIYLIICLILIITNFICNKKNLFIRGAWSSILKRYIQGEGSDRWVNLLFLVYTLFHLSWIADAIFDTVKEPGIYLIWHPVIFIVGYLIAFVMKPLYSGRKNIKKTDRKILITGISEIKYNLSKKDHSLYCNLDVVLKIFNDYTELNKIQILLSDQLLNNHKDICVNVNPDSDYYNAMLTYKEAVSEYMKDRLSLDKNDKEWINEQLRSLIVACLSAKYPERSFSELELECSDPVDYNSFESAYETFSKLLKCYKGDDDYRIIINITSGTSVVSGAATIHAIMRDRGLIYTDQSSGKIIEYNPDVSVFPELLKELSKHN